MQLDDKLFDDFPDLTKDVDFVTSVQYGTVVEAIFKGMEELNLNRQSMAKRLDMSTELLHSILEEEVELTIEMISKIAIGLDKELIIRLEDI